MCLQPPRESLSTTAHDFIYSTVQVFGMHWWEIMGGNVLNRRDITANVKTCSVSGENTFKLILCLLLVHSLAHTHTNTHILTLCSHCVPVKSSKNSCKKKRILLSSVWGVRVLIMITVLFELRLCIPYIDYYKLSSSSSSRLLLPYYRTKSWCEWYTVLYLHNLFKCWYTWKTSYSIYSHMFIQVENELQFCITFIQESTVLVIYSRSYLTLIYLVLLTFHYTNTWKLPDSKVPGIQHYSVL